MEEESRTTSVRKKRSRDQLEDNGDFIMLSSSDEASDPNSNKRRKVQSGKIIYDISSDESGEINESESGNVKIKNGVIMIDHDDEGDDVDRSKASVEDEEDATGIAADDSSIFPTPGIELRDVAACGCTMLLAVANPVEEDAVPQTRGKPPKKSSMRANLAKFVGEKLSDGLRAATTMSIVGYRGELFPSPHHAAATLLLAYQGGESRDLAVAITQSTTTTETTGLLYRAGLVELRMLPASAHSVNNQRKERTSYHVGLNEKNKVKTMEANVTRKLQAGQTLSKKEKKLLQAKASETTQSSSSTDIDVGITNKVDSMEVNATRKLQAGQSLPETKESKKAAAGPSGRTCHNCGQAGHVKTNKKLCPMLNGTIKMDLDSGADVGITKPLLNNTSMPAEQPADTSVPVEQPATVTEAHDVAVPHSSSAEMTLPTEGETARPEQPVTQARLSHQDAPQSNDDYRSASLTYAPRATDPENPFERFTQPPLPLPEYPILVQELDEEGQLEQKRYFQLSDGDEVACLICDGRGHQEDHCPERTCRHCKAIDVHFARTCPVQRKCPRCHERGHVEEECTSKLRNTEPPPCDICSGLHHEEDCPWRFRKMPDPSLALRQISDALLVCCHNCATSRSHFTDDCPLRDRSKQSHAEWSCWSADFAKHFATAEAWATAGLRLPGYHGGVPAKPVTKKAVVASSKPTKTSERARPEYDDFSHLDARLQHRADTYSPPPPRRSIPRADNYRPQTRGYQNDRDDDRYDDYRDRYSNDYSRRDRYEDDYAPARGYAPPSNANYGYGPVSGSKSGSYHSVPPPQSLESRISGGRGGAAGAPRGGKHAQSNAKKRPIDEARERFASGGGGAGSDSSSRGGGGRGKGRARGRGK